MVEKGSVEKGIVEKGTIAIALVREALQEPARRRPAADWLVAAGIAPELLDDPGARVTAEQYAGLWRLIAHTLDDEFFGMDPRRMKSGSFDYLCRSSLQCATLADALDNALAFLALVFERLRATLVRRQSLAEIVVEEDAEAPRRAFAYFTYWMLVHGAACWLVGRRIPLIAVELRCPAPAYCDDYRVMFSENLRFDRPRSRIIFAAEYLDLPIKRSAEELARFLALAPANILVKYRDPDSLASRVKRHLRNLPPETWPDTAQLAGALFMSESTLRRRLAEAGQPYQTIKDQVRRELAVVWLADADIAFAEIAHRLGFADASSFYKAFRKWTGSNPGHYRSLILAEP